MKTDKIKMDELQKIAKTQGKNLLVEEDGTYVEITPKYSELLAGCVVVFKNCTTGNTEIAQLTHGQTLIYGDLVNGQCVSKSFTCSSLSQDLNQDSATVTVSIPGGRGASISIVRDANLGQKADISIRSAHNAPNDTELDSFTLSANPTPDKPFITASYPETRQVLISGFHYHGSAVHSSLGKVMSNDGNTIVVGFDDLGSNDRDYNDCQIIVKLK